MSIEMRGYMDNFNKKLNENKSEKPIDNNEELINKIEDLIHGTVILRDVPYSMEDGAKELDPSSVTEAAKFILELLKKGDSNIENKNTVKIGFDDEIKNELKRYLQNTVWNKVGGIDNRVDQLMKLHSKFISFVRNKMSDDEIDKRLFQYEKNILNRE